MAPEVIILSGGPNSVHVEGAPTVFSGFFEYCAEHGVTVLGICYGMQLIVDIFGGKVEPADKREYGRMPILITPGSTMYGAAAQSPQVRCRLRVRVVWSLAKRTTQPPGRKVAPPTSFETAMEKSSSCRPTWTSKKKARGADELMVVCRQRAPYHLTRGLEPAELFQTCSKSPSYLCRCQNVSMDLLCSLMTWKMSWAGLGGVGAAQSVWMSHGDEAKVLPDGFKVVAKSEQVNRQGGPHI